MLIETTFRLGAAICIVLAVALVGTLVATGDWADAITLSYVPVIMVLIGGLFLTAGRDAAAARAKLLADGDRGVVPPP